MITILIRFPFLSRFRFIPVIASITLHILVVLIHPPTTPIMLSCPHLLPLSQSSHVPRHVPPERCPCPRPRFRPRARPEPRHAGLGAQHAERVESLDEPFGPGIVREMGALLDGKQPASEPEKTADVVDRGEAGREGDDDGVGRWILGRGGRGHVGAEESVA